VFGGVVTWLFFLIGEALLVPATSPRLEAGAG